MIKKIHLFAILVALATVSCHVQEQVQTFGRVFSPASNGNVAQTIELFDTIQKFKNPIINRKYTHTKKAYSKRFIENDEKTKRSSKNDVINDICTIYYRYWDLKLMNSPLNEDSLLYNNLAHYLVDQKLTELSYEALRPDMQNDKELSRVIADQGFYSRFLYLNEIQDVLIWEQEKDRKYTISLPNDELDIAVVFIKNYANKGCIDYATFGMNKIGGWAASDSPKLFCNRGTYKLNSEKYKVSYLKHEALHFVDIRSYPNLEAADLEYRSKLVELMYASKKTIHKLLVQFIIGGSNETRNNSHAYANYCIHHHFSKAIFNKDFENDLSKWKELSAEQINEVSSKLYDACTKKLKEDPSLKWII